MSAEDETNLFRLKKEIPKAAPTSKARPVWQLEEELTSVLDRCTAKLGRRGWLADNAEMTKREFEAALASADSLGQRGAHFGDENSYVYEAILSVFSTGRVAFVAKSRPLTGDQTPQEERR